MVNPDILPLVGKAAKESRARNCLVLVIVWSMTITIDNRLIPPARAEKLRRMWLGSH